MEITIGVQHTNRELALDTDMSADEITAALGVALAEDGVLDLTDSRGRRTLIPASRIGYLEIGPEETRRVGFGSL